MASQDPIQSCQLIGFIGIIIQVILAALSFSVLIYKRYTEYPKRAWKIWAMDTSKQGVSQILAHIINVVISIHLSTSIESDACIWYLTTNIMDNTLGVFLCVGVLSMIEKNLFAGNYTRYQSGNYYTILTEYEDEQIFGGGDVMIEGESKMRSLEITRKKTRYEINYFDWVVQFIVWNLIVVISKTLLFYTELLLSGPIIDIAVFLIGWIQPYQTLELILVIIVVPVIMNGLAFWIQDNFLKKKETAPTAVKVQKLSIRQKIKNRDISDITTVDSDDHNKYIDQPLL